MDKAQLFRLLSEIEGFHQASLSGAYYAPFNMNSRNYRHVPAKTNEWFNRLGEFLESASLLSDGGDHVHAVRCFGVLYELIAAMERGEDIVFAEEYGTWMIPGDDTRFVRAYLTSLAATATPEEFARAALPLIRRDSHESFTVGTYGAATQAADPAQKAHLEGEVRRLGIRTGKDS